MTVWKEMFVPPDNTTLAHKFQRVSASHLVKLRKEMVVQPDNAILANKFLRMSA